MEVSPIVLRFTILSAVKQQKPLNELYEQICKEFGKKAIEYSELELWYQTFYNKEHKTESDNSSNNSSVTLNTQSLQVLGGPATSGDNSRKTNDKLPIDIRLNHRKANNRSESTESKDRTPKNIKLLIASKHASLDVDSKNILYYEEKQGCKKVIDSYKTFLLPEAHYVDKVLGDLEYTMKKEELRLDSLSITISVPPCDKFGNWQGAMGFPRLRNIFHSMKHQVQTEDLQIRGIHLEHVLIILPFFKAKVLKCLHIEQIDEKNDIKLIGLLKEMSELDQWKTLEQLKIQFFGCKELPYDCFQNFSSIHILDKMDIGLEFTFITQMLKTLTNLNYLSIPTMTEVNEFCKLSHEDIEILKPQNPPDVDSITRAVFTIPNTKSVFETKFTILMRNDAINFTRRVEQM